MREDRKEKGDVRREKLDGRDRPALSPLSSFLGMLLCVLGAAQAPAADVAGERIPAFPGAEGFGAYSRGGRGGRIVEVTNLNAKGPGSLQAACDAKGPRIVVFRVSGTIDVHGHITITEPFITIAGQTAPGDGICLRDAKLRTYTHDIVIRYLRVRPGDGPFGPYASNRGCISIYDIPGSGHGRGHNVIVDHCSFSWGTDQNVNCGGTAPRATYQWCITSEALEDSIHPKSPHSRATLLSGNGTRLSFHHCLLAHCDGRNPLIANVKGKDFAIHDFRNNVIYRRGAVWSQILGHPRVNYVGNFLKVGANDKVRPGSRGISWKNPYGKKYGPARLYVKDNVWPLSPKGEKSDWEILEPVYKGKRKPSLGFARLTEAVPAPPVTTETAAQAYESVLRFAGCTRPVRDVVDARIIAEVRTGTGHVIDSQEDVGGWPTYASTQPPADADHDAMPDAWEKRCGFKPNDPADGPKDRDGDGYTNVEEFLNRTDPARPDSGARIPHPPVVVQTGNDRMRGEAARRIGRERLARLKRVNATKESREALLKKVRESGREVADVLGIKFVRIPAGEVMMGKVKVILSKPYELSAYEITQAQWEAVMGTRPWRGQAHVNEDAGCPATHVNYFDCQEFISRLNASGDRKYRLPTWSEWCHAARGGTDSPYGFGSEWRRVHEYAWCFARLYNEQKRMVGKRVPRTPQPVGLLKPNPYGIYDMAGNVAEWCHDWFGTWSYRKGSPRTDPTGPKRGKWRFYCGGHFADRQRPIIRYQSSMHNPHHRGFVGLRLRRAARAAGAH